MELQKSKDMLEMIRDAEAGQGLVEYALMILFVSIVSVLALTALGTSVSGLIDSAGAAFP